VIPAGDDEASSQRPQRTVDLMATRRQCRRADQIAEHHRQLPSDEIEATSAEG
jgi:hypothetical protein